MKPLFLNIELDKSKTTDKLLCECYFCSKPFLTTKRKIMYSLRGHKDTAKFCSRKCLFSSREKKILCECLNCGKQFNKIPAEVGDKNFCSKRCSVIYNNKNKSHGYRRSKLEIWIEQQLTEIYPDLHIDYNKTSAINSELDIYIPSINIAFELNGIFHYEPIYGIDKLEKIQENDVSKSKSCHDTKIDLCIIDTSSQKYVKPSTSQKYLDIILNIIKERLSIL
jgi:hypothetical protein